MSAKFELHGAAISVALRRVAVVCKQLGVEYERVQVEWSDIKTPEHYALHPFGQVPVYKDKEDGLVLYESRAISKYIVQKYGKGSSLVPPASDLKESAKFDAAVSIEQSDFDKYASDLVFEQVFKQWYGQETDPARVKALNEALEPKLDGYERILSKQKYLAGNNLTLADLYHLPNGYLLSNKVGSKLFDNPSRPNVKRWWDELTALPAWQEVKEVA